MPITSITTKCHARVHNSLKRTAFAMSTKEKLRFRSRISSASSLRGDITNSFTTTHSNSTHSHPPPKPSAARTKNHSNSMISVPRTTQSSSRNKTVKPVTKTHHIVRLIHLPQECESEHAHRYSNKLETNDLRNESRRCSSPPSGTAAAVTQPMHPELD